MTWRVDEGDCLDVLRGMADASIDAVVTDPPYGLSSQPEKLVRECLAAWLAGERYVPTGAGFMGKSWDGWVPGPEVWRECGRVLKPGGHMLVFASTRTADLMGIGLRLAGFEVRDSLAYIFASGFPKSLNVSKAIDKAAGVAGEANIRTLPATAAARQWEGFGTALKPAMEMILLCRKPLEGTVAANVQAFGTGALNIDGTRIGTSDNLNGGGYTKTASDREDGYENWRFKRGDKGNIGEYQQPSGRWPSNVILGHSAACEPVGTRQVASNGHYLGARPAGSAVSGPSGHAGQDGLVERKTAGEVVDVYRCAPDCPVRLLDEQSGVRTSGANPTRRGSDEFRDVFGAFEGQAECAAARGAETGSASRFFFTSKPSRTERDAGLDGARSTHPTVKPLDLMRYLVRLVTPRGGTVLDPFTGSGSTGCAAVQEGFNFLGMERESEYVALARSRIAAAERDIGVSGVRAAELAAVAPTSSPVQLGMFADVNESVDKRRDVA